MSTTVAAGIGWCSLILLWLNEQGVVEWELWLVTQQREPVCYFWVEYGVNCPVCPDINFINLGPVIVVKNTFRLSLKL